MSIVPNASQASTQKASIQLVIDKSLATLPRRKTDNAIIVRSQDADAGKARVFKLNAVAEDPILLERCAFFALFGWLRALM